jgi:hypothetical protein
LSFWGWAGVGASLFVVFVILGGVCARVFFFFGDASRPYRESLSNFGFFLRGPCPRVLPRRLVSSSSPLPLSSACFGEFGGAARPDSLFVFLAINLSALVCIPSLSLLFALSLVYEKRKRRACGSRLWAGLGADADVVPFSFFPFSLLFSFFPSFFLSLPLPSLVILNN